VNRWDDAAVEYTDVAAIKESLVGRSIVSTLSEGDGVDRVLTFVLDDGTLLRAHATDGGCACSNGCFTVEPGNVVRGTITNVEVEEFASSWDTAGEQPVAPGSVSDGEGTIRIFVYGELGKQLLVESQGSDNGYYGWGFWLSAVRPNQEGVTA